MKKLVIITGLTASGKSGLALNLSSKFDGEIISCDCVQVYKGLDIGSAKESIENRKKIKHYLIDIINPDESYNVSNFIEDCKIAVKACLDKGKIPFIVGGTAMYVKALLEGFSLGSEANLEFRKYYQDYAKEHGKLAVWKELNKIDSELASKVHYNNLNRVIRYLEFAKFGKPEKTEPVFRDLDVLAIGINEDKEKIYPKINERVDIMFNEGLVDEVKGLLESNLSLNCQSLNSIGYKETCAYLKGEIDLNRCKELIKQHTRNYAKRQLTFMKTIKDLKIMTKQEAEKEITKFLSN